MRSSIETRQLVLAALLTAIGIVLNIAESLLPVAMPVPGAKIGLANIAVLLCLYLLPLKLTMAVFGLRLVLASLLLGTFLSSTFFIGATGGLFSFATMYFVKKLPGVSVTGTSIAGAAAHNLGQVLMASLFISNFALFYYLPFALAFALPAGLLTGFVAGKGIDSLVAASK